MSGLVLAMAAALSSAPRPEARLWDARSDAWLACRGERPAPLWSPKGWVLRAETVDGTVRDVVLYSPRDGRRVVASSECPAR